MMEMDFPSERPSNNNTTVSRSRARSLALETAPLKGTPIGRARLYLFRLPRGVPLSTIKGPRLAAAIVCGHQPVSQARVLHFHSHWEASPVDTKSARLPSASDMACYWLEICMFCEVEARSGPLGMLFSPRKGCRNDAWRLPINQTSVDLTPLV